MKQTSTDYQPPKVQAVRPTSLTLFMRNWLPWQLYRFIVINFKMTIMIAKSHDRIRTQEEMDQDQINTNTTLKKAS